MEFIAPSWTNRPTDTGNIRWRHYEGDDGVATPGAGNDQVFVERRFQSSRVRNAQDGIRRFHVVCDTHPWLRLIVFGKPLVDIATNPDIERPISLRDAVLDVKRGFLHIRMTVKSERSSFTRQVAGRKDCARRPRGIAQGIQTRCPQYGCAVSIQLVE